MASGRLGRALGAPQQLPTSTSAKAEQHLRSLELDLKTEADLKALEECFSHCPGCGRGVRDLRAGCRAGLVTAEILRVELEQERGSLRGRVRQYEVERGDCRRREEQLRARVKALEVQRDGMHRQLERLNSEGRSRSSLAASKALAKSSMILSGASLAVCFRAWHSLLEDKRKEQLEAHRHHMASSQKKQYDGVLNSFAQSSTRAQKRSAFTAWLTVVQDNFSRASERKRCATLAKRALIRTHAAEDQAQVAFCWISWRLAVELRRHEDGDARNAMRARQRQGQIDRAVGGWAESSNAFYLRCCFVCWVWTHQRAHELGAEKEKRSLAANRALAKFCSSQDAGMLHVCLASWRSTLDEKRKELEAANKKRMEDLQQQQYQRAMDAWAQSSNRTFLQSCWMSWTSLVRELKDRARLESEEKERRHAIAMKTCAKLCASEATSSLQMCLIAWAGILEEKRRAAMQAERERLEALQQQQYERALGCWANSSEKLLRHTSFSAWSTALQEAKAEREAATRERTKSSEAAMKALAKFCAAEADGICRLTFGAWFGILQERRGEAIEAERHRLKQLQQKQFESAMGCMAQSSDRVLRRSCFVAWSEALREARQAAEERAKRSESAMKALSKFVNAEGENLSRLAMGAWRGVIEEKRREEISEERHRLVQLQQKQFESALGCMAAGSERVLRRSSYIAWRDAVEQRKADILEMARKSEAALKTVSKLIASEGDNLARLCFGAWRSVLEKNRMETIEAERSRLLLLQQKQFESALGCMAQSSERVLRRSCFVSWGEALANAKMEVLEKARRSESAMKALAKFCASEQDSFCRICFASWHTTAAESLRDKISEDRHRMLDQNHKQFEQALRCLAVTSDRTLRDSAFVKWRESVELEKGRAFKEMQERVAKSESALKTLRAMMAAETGNTRSLCFSAWKEAHVTEMHEKMENERQRLKALQNKQAESALGALAKSSDRALKASFFGHWTQMLRVLHFEQQSVMEEKVKRASMAMQALQKMTTSNDHASMRAVFSAWGDALKEAIFAGIQAEKDALKDMQRKQFEGALRCMAQSSERALRSSAFVVWRDVLWEVQALQAAELEERARQSHAAVSAITQVIAADHSALTRICLGAWRQVLEERRQEAIAAERQKIKTMQLKGYEKAMGGLAQSNAQVMLRTVWTTWLLAARESKEHRQAELQEKARRSEHAMKALARFCKNDANSNLRLCVGAWCELLAERRREAIEEERRRMRSTHAKQAERALGGLAQNSDGALLRSCFVGWQHDAREVRLLRQKELEEKAKRSEVAMKSLAKFCQANDAAGLRMIFGAWVVALAEKRKAAMQAERDKLTQMQKAQFEKTAGCLAQSSDRAHKGSCFKAWHEALRLSRERKAVELEEKAKRSAVAMKSLAKFCDSQASASINMCFSVWCKAMELKRKEALEAEKQRLVEMQKAQYDRAMGVWAQSSQKALRQETFAAWSGLLAENKVRKKLEAEGRAKRSEVAMKGLGKFLASQGRSLLQVFFSAWRSLLEDKSREVIDSEIRKLHAEKAKLQADRSLRSLCLSRLGARQRTRRCRLYFLEWSDATGESKGRPGGSTSAFRRRDRSHSPAHLRANKHTTVGALLASAQAEAQSRDSLRRRGLGSPHRVEFG